MMIASKAGFYYELLLLESYENCVQISVFLWLAYGICKFFSFKIQVHEVTTNVLPMLKVIHIIALVTLEFFMYVEYCFK